MSLAPPARYLAAAAILATVAGALVAAPAGAATTTTTLPQITALSSTSGDTSCGSSVTVTGQNLDGANQVLFGSVQAGFQVLSPNKLSVYVPAHGKAKVAVRVVTAAGASPVTPQARYAWVAHPLSMHTTKLNCGMTAVQAIANSNKYKQHAAKYLSVPTVRRVAHWTPAMAANAVRRAQAWTGLTYAFAGGNAAGPTYGIKSSGGGWFDNKIWGFDCSGLTLYSWAPYKPMAHFAATQYKQAGRFHPGPNELMPGDLVFYSYSGRAAGIDHVQMYVGGGQIIQAPESGYTIGTATLYPGAHPFFAATRPLTRGAQGGAPSITRLSVTSGPAATTTTVLAYGSGLNYVSTVLVGGVRTYAFTSLSAHQLKITLPAHAAGTVTVRIGGAWGVSNSLPFTYLGAPTVDGVSPNNGAADTTQAVTISGSGFVDVTGVSVGGVAAQFTVTAAGTISATLPAMPAGTYPIVVTTRYGSSPGWTSFTYAPAAGSGDPGGTGGGTGAPGGSGGWSSGPGAGAPGP